MSKIVYVENNEIENQSIFKNRRNQVIMLVVCAVLSIGAFGNFAMGVYDGYYETNESIDN